MFGLRGQRVAALVAGMALAVAGAAALVTAAPAGAATTTIGQLGGTGSACAPNLDIVQASVSSGPSFTVRRACGT